jgi:hypothetical protein
MTEGRLRFFDGLRMGGESRSDRLPVLLIPLTLALSRQGRENKINKAVIVTREFPRYNSGISAQP